MQYTDFSIVIPAYNDVTLLRKALNSVRSQEGVSFDIVIVDDSNKNDDIEAYVTTLNDNRITYMHNRPSLGAVANWNSGLRLCHGNHIIVLHHDETLKTNRFLSDVSRYIANSDVVVCNIEIHRHGIKAYNLAPDYVKRAVLHCPSLLFSVNLFGPSATVVFKRDIIQFFDERLKWFVDVEWYYRLLKGHKAVYANDVCIVSHHGHEEQISRNIDTIAEARKDAEVMRQKYRSNYCVRFTTWLFINVIHNSAIRQLSHKILRR